MGFVAGVLEGDEPEHVYDWYRRREFEKKHRKALAILINQVERDVLWATDLPSAAMEVA